MNKLDLLSKFCIAALISGFILFFNVDSLAQTGCGTWSGTVSPSKIWNGSVDQNWENASNWTPSGVPSSTHNVYVPSGCTRQPYLWGGYPDNGNPNTSPLNYPMAQCYSITIQSSTGAILTWTSDSAILKVHGSI